MNYDGQNLSGLDFSGLDLRDVSFKGADLTDTIFDGAQLDRADFSGTTFFRTSFIGASMVSVSMPGANGDADYTDANLSRADLQGVNFSGSIFMNTKMNEANLTNAKFPHDGYYSLQNLDLRGATLDNTNFWYADLTHVKFGNNTNPKIQLNEYNRVLQLPSDYYFVQHGANYLFGPNMKFNVEFSEDIRLQEADLSNIDFSGSTLYTSTIYGNETLKNTTFENVTLLVTERGVPADGIDLSGSTISGITIAGRSFEGRNINWDFSNTVIEGGVFGVPGFSYLDFTNANFNGARLVDFSRYSRFPDNVKILARVKDDVVIEYNKVYGNNNNLDNLDLTYGIWNVSSGGGSFIGSDFRFSNFQGDFNFSGADLKNANFSGVDLTGVNFTNADLTDTNFTNAIVDREYWTSLSQNQIEALQNKNDISIFLDSDSQNTSAFPDETLIFKSENNTSLTVSSGKLKGLEQDISFTHVEIDSSNYDNGISIGDVILQLRDIVGLSTLQGKQRIAADINGDGDVNISDVISNLRHIVGLDAITKCALLDNSDQLVTDLTEFAMADLTLIQYGDVDLSATFLIV